MKELLKVSVGIVAFFGFAALVGGIPSPTTSEKFSPTAGAASFASKCDTKQIGLDQVQMKKDGTNHYQILGEITNNCDHAVGVQLALVFRDKAGNLLKVARPWPASIANIPSNKPFPFDLSLTLIDPDSMTATVEDTRVW